MTKEHEAEQSQNPLGYSIQFWKPVLRHSQGGAREGTELFCKKEAWYFRLFLEKLYCVKFDIGFLCTHYGHSIFCSDCCKNN